LASTMPAMPAVRAPVAAPAPASAPTPALASVRPRNDRTLEMEMHFSQEHALADEPIVEEESTASSALPAFVPHPDVDGAGTAPMAVAVRPIIGIG
ncbi:MAG: hypothetical protein J0L92_30915, partial [Deltaproteobacteria bacterium]|nr:hypothetical protein [Deltaproteobacteria bacterium]